MKMKVSDYIAQFLKANGTDVVFEIAGGMITHLLDSLGQAGGIRVVTVHHEQAASFAAEAWARATGRPGVAFATSGPGAINLLTGIGSCYFDSVPGVFITGQVNRHEQKGERAIRQLGFQETDIVRMAGPVTKAALQIRAGTEVEGALKEAWRLSMCGRPGPVLLDLPMDVQREEVEFKDFVVPAVERGGSEAGARVFCEKLSAALAKAERPLIIAGRGVRAAGAGEEFRALTETLGVPVAMSLLGLDLLPYQHDLRLGFLGTYGNRWVNMAIGRADLLLVLGSRLDIRQTGADIPGFSAGKKVFHVDCEQGELNNRLKDCEVLQGDLKGFFGSAAKAVDAGKAYSAWRTELSALKASWPDTAELSGLKGINPNTFIHQLSAASAQAGVFIADVGNHQMWAAQSLELGAGQLFFTSGGMGSMGYALPAALGATLGQGGKPCVVIAGDGGFQLNLQELQTIRTHSLPVKMVVLNNQCLGMIRQFQDSYFESRYQSTVWGYQAPDFAAVARAYDLPGLTLKTPDEVEAGLAWLWKNPQEPALLQVMIDQSANAYPKIAFGRPITEMEPQSKPAEMEGT